MEKISQFLQLVVIDFAGHQITAGQIIVIPVVFVVGYLLARWFGHLIVKRMEARGVSPDVVHLVRRVYLILILVIIGVSALEILSVPLTAFAFISGAIAIGVGFGAQNVINNFISGWILLWERPIRIGDFLEIGDTRGTVEAINTRSTRIRRVDGVHLLIPNSHLLENTVVNWTLVDRLTRGHVRVGVAYGSPVRLVAQLIEQAVKEDAHVLETPAVMVIFDDFGDSALIFDVYFWIEASGEKDLRVIRSDIRFRIDELFREHNVTISFPQRDVHLTSLTPVQVALVNDTENAGG
ncbi:MAG: mechanosensitive ion channel [Gammaproteobacteria bacterium]|jgi:small-conductance mechanosensitive channel